MSPSVISTLKRCNISLFNSFSTHRCIVYLHAGCHARLTTLTLSFNTHTHTNRSMRLYSGAVWYIRHALCTQQHPLTRNLALMDILQYLIPLTNTSCVFSSRHCRMLLEADQQGIIPVKPLELELAYCRIKRVVSSVWHGASSTQHRGDGTFQVDRARLPQTEAVREKPLS